MESLFKKIHLGVMAQFNDIQVLDIPISEIHLDLQIVLTKNKQYLETLKYLPPSRGEHDHGIPLISSSQPPNVHPYWYPFSQKNEIEKIAQELLEANIIRPTLTHIPPQWSYFYRNKGLGTCVQTLVPSISWISWINPYPSHWLSIGWAQQCQFFHKLDLCSRYHQILMKEVDISEIYFCTHEGHYEFLVIPFGHFSSPSTFQSLMNKILIPYLHDFMLVFFGDILIYNRTWQAHVHHVDKALQLLRDHKLFIKLSKFSFRVSEVE